VATYNGVTNEGTAGRLLLIGIVIAGTAALFGALTLPAAIALDWAVETAESTILDIPPLPEDDITLLPENSLILAEDGSELAELHAEENRVMASLSEIPPVTQNAVLATEDADFFRHKGVNHRAMARALIRNVQAGEVEEGGSTVTQQLVKNTLLTQARTVDRKLHEAVWSIELERRMSKNEILEAYLNTTYFGRGVYGVGTAARFYFSKDVSELGLGESALLAALIRSPERNNPVNDPVAAEARRDIVLRQMARQGFISDSEAEDAIAQPLEFEIDQDGEFRQPFFVEWIKRVLYDENVTLQPDAQEAIGETRDERRRAVFEGGLVVRTTLRPEWQDIAEETVRRYLSDPLTSPLGSLVTVDSRTGAIVTMALGPKEFGDCEDAGGEPCPYTKLNPVVPGGGGSGRQTGSAFKPVVAAAALEEGFTPGYTEETTSGQEIEGCGYDEPYEPRNFADSGGGYMNMYEAMTVSNNVYHVKLSRDAGVTKVRDLAIRLGMEHSPNLPSFGDLDCSIGLGSANVFPLEFTGAFAVFANRGERCAPFAITSIEDRAGNVIYQHRDECDRVLDRGVADRINEILRGPVQQGGTAAFVEGQIGRPVAGKTGTTNDFKDAWFAGYVPQYATVAWVGHEVPEELFGVTADGVSYDRVTGGSIPALMWADYMVAVLEGVDVEDFAQPPPIPTATVPSVVGRHVDEATRTLEDRDFKVRTRSVTHHSSSGTVIAQEPGAGDEAWVGSIVTLDVSDGQGAPPPPPPPPPPEEEDDPDLATVPDVIGQREREAVRTLRSAGFDVQRTCQDTRGRADIGRVVDQSPGGGTEAEEGDRVVIAVGDRDCDGDADDDD
jgi:penicillin-binding protein 1A